MNAFLECVCSYEKYSSYCTKHLEQVLFRCLKVDIAAMSEKRHFSLRCGAMHFKQTHLTSAAHLTFESRSFQSRITTDLLSFFPSQVGGACKLSTESSQRRCRTPDGKICSGRGKCDCGICICEATDPGKFYGPRCECHDWVCATLNGKTCNGAYL